MTSLAVRGVALSPALDASPDRGTPPGRQSEGTSRPFRDPGALASSPASLSPGPTGGMASSLGHAAPFIQPDRWLWLLNDCRDAADLDGTVALLRGLLTPEQQGDYLRRLRELGGRP